MKRLLQPFDNSMTNQFTLYFIFVIENDKDKSNEIN
jgi:hypothetical protein